jgi:methionyl-tRNA formyltransferase
MRITILTQDEPFYLARSLDYLLDRMPAHSRVVHCILLDPSPFGKRLSMAAKLWQTWRVFGTRFFAFYTIRFLTSRLSRRNRVRRVLEKYDIPVTDISGSVNSPESLELIRAQRPDLLVSIAGNQIFKKKLRNLAPNGCLNLHTALLPKYRGLMPSFWVLKNGEEETGVSVFFMDEGIDNGPIIVQKRIAIGDMSQAELIRQSKIIGMDAIIEAVEKIEAGGYELIPNDGDQKTYFSFPTRKDVREFYRAGKRFF